MKRIDLCYNHSVTKFVLILLSVTDDYSKRRFKELLIYMNILYIHHEHIIVW